MTDRLLVVDDDPDQGALLHTMLSDLGFGVQTTTSPKEALRLVGEQAFCAILTDLDMDEMSGLALCERFLEAVPHTPVVVIAGLASLDAAIEAMRAGAYDFLSKPVEAQLLGLRISRAVEHGRLASEVVRLRVEADEGHAWGLIGESPAMRADRPERSSLSSERVEEVITVDELERRYITRVIELVEGNKSKAAQLLGLDRRTLYRKLDRYRQAEQRAGRDRARQAGSEWHA